MKECECCGHPLPDDDITAHLTLMQRRIYTKVLKSGTQGIAMRDLFEWVYADDRNGGPLSTNIISVVAKNIRQRIEPHGVTLKASRGPGSRYYITKLAGKETPHAQA